MPADIHDRLLALTSPFAADLVRIARAEGHAAGLASGLERGRLDAQTEIDGLTYERGRDDERARCEALYVYHSRLSCGVGPLLLAAIRSGVTAPEGK